MANIKNFGLVGIGPQVQFGKGGTQLTSSNGLFAAMSNDGSAFVRFQVAAPTTNDDATTKNYVDTVVASVNTLVTNLTSELTATQLGAGLSASGTYTANGAANYIASASSLADADNKLDAALYVTNGVISAIETATGLSNNGTYIPFSAGTYINTAVSLLDADKKLDAAIGLATGAVTSETNRAEAAETSLATSIASEVSRATDAEGTLTNTLFSEVNRAESAETSLATSIASEVSRATAVEGSLTSSLSSEVTRAMGAETSLATSVSTEVSRATAAEATLANTIAAETARAEAAEASASGNVAAEAARAMAAETTLTANLAAEVSRATAAEGSLTSDLTAEVTRATYAEGTLTAAISAEATRAGNAETSLATSIATEVTRATGAEATISSNLTFEIARATAAEGTLTANLSSETSRAQAAEATLTTSVAAEVARAQGAEGTLTTNLAAEVARAGLAEGSLDTRLTAVEGTYIKKDGSVAFTGTINAGSNGIINLNNPVNPGDAANKSYVDSVITSLGSVFEFIGTVAGGASQSAPTVLTSLSSQTTGSYYSVTTAGYFTDGSNTFFAQALDGIVKTPTDWSTIAHVDTVITGTTNFVDVNGSVDTGFIIDLDTAFINRVITLESDAATLTTDLAAEVSRAEGAESALYTNLGTVANALTAETGRAEDAESTLTSNLTAEISRATSAETMIAGNLASEVNRAMAAEATLTSSVSSEVSRAESAEASLASSISAETARAEAAEASASGNVAAEAARAMAAESTLAANLSSEVSRATAAEGTLTSSIATEVIRAQSAETTLTSGLAAEVSRATAAETSLSASISTETSRAETAEASLSTGVASEASRAMAAESTLTANLAAEVARATAAEGTLTTSLANEVSRATAAEATLTTSVAAEVTRAQAAEGTLTNSLAAEVSRATAAEGTLSITLTSVENAVGLSNTGTFIPFTSSNYMNSATNIVGALTALDTETETLANELANLSQDTIKDTATGLYTVHTASTATQFFANVGGTSTLVGSVVGSNSASTTNSAFTLDMSVANEVRLEATSTTASDVDLRLIPMGAGHVYIGETGSGIVQGDDGYDLTVAGGDNASGSAGNLVLRGGNGTANGIVRIADALGNNIATFAGTTSPTSYIALTNGTTTATIKAAGTGNVDLVLAPNNSGNISASSVRVMNVAAPTTGTDAANKTYVDTQVAAVTTASAYGAVLSRVGTLSETTGSVNLGAVITGTVVRVRVLVTTAFTSGSSITIGTSGSPASLMDATQIDDSTPGAYIADVAAGYTTTQLVATVTAGSGSTGAAQVFVEYINTAS